ncbi:uncharacterized protein LOC124450257 [Xenia sp. Carnegie-2017]|uniref:uncharacterized protein LOC124450257 n=1 Tax=Xenia sp. Carnegie-2017 TaxID=2897299 RepID=UPI001F038C98|nr:uncharacterized protein LOC124450257 [Xenia sp. Carnegie-2017]XP_046856845.1 uncharacterized protein LOC124450257 [Xenia sp. Carnegie-2017]
MLHQPIPPLYTIEKQNPVYIHKSPPNVVLPGYPPQQQQPGHSPPSPPGMQQQSSSSTTVENQPQPTVVAPIQVVNNHLILSIVSFFCCWILGAFAIFKSSEAKARFDNGDYAGAVAAARSARNRSFIAIMFGTFMYTVIIVLIRLL